MTVLTRIEEMILLAVYQPDDNASGITSVSNELNYQSLMFSPFVILGGLFAAFVINTLSIFHIKYRDGEIIGILHIKLKAGY